MEYYKAMNYWTIGGFEGAKAPFQAIDDVKNMGLDGIEFIFGECPRADISEQECRDIVKYAKEKGVGLRTMAAGYHWQYSMGEDDEAARERAINSTIKYIKVASWLNVDRILVIPGTVDVPWDESRPVTSYRNVWNNATDSLNRVLKIAEEYRVTLCIENVWNKFLLSPIEFKMFVDQFDSEYVGVYFDVGNAILNGYPEHWIEILQNRIKAIHFKNFKRHDCGGNLHGFGENLLEGDVNFTNVLRELDKIEYSGPITVEMIPFSRQPDLILPDMQLAEKTAKDLKELLK